MSRAGPVVVAALVLAVIASVATPAAGSGAAGPAPTPLAGPSGGLEDRPGSTRFADAPGPGDRPGPTSFADTAGTLRVSYEVSLTPETPGEVEVRATVRVPPSVGKLRVDLPRGSTVLATEGFRQGDESDLAWDGTTDAPTFAYAAPANRTEEGIEGASFVDAGDWALVGFEAVDATVRWAFRGTEPSFSESFAVDGTGFAGPSLGFLGSHRVYTREANGTIALVVPASARVAAGREAVLAALTDASARLRRRAGRPRQRLRRAAARP